jgi:magnesium-transporting ATPase (P-type)
MMILIIGVASIMEMLKTNIDQGLTPTDFDARSQAFSNNFKAPPKITPYWKLFLGAMEDFMLRFLIVCASVDIIIECATADKEHLQTGK